MYQMKIKVVTTSGPADKNPTVNWIHPDLDLKKFAELKDVKIDDLVLLHEKDTHFNLVTSKESDLAKYGSLSFRFNIGPMNDADEDKDDEIIDEDESLELEDISKVKKALKECEKSKKTIEAEYYKCEKELNLKTEECEKLKIVIKDLKQLLELNADLESEVQKDKQKGMSEKVLVDEQDQGKPTEDSWILNSRKRKMRNSKPQLPSGKSKYEKEYNCIDCDYQGTSSCELEKHVELKHTAGVPKDESLKCRICGEKWKLMTHRKEKHITSVACCRNNMVGKCIFSDSMCWWNHSEQTPSEVIKCFVCNETFANKPDMMVHRKKAHSDIIKKCTQFESNTCRFQGSDCWYKHGNDSEEEEVEVEVEETIHEHNSVFQKASVNPKPPLVTRMSSRRDNSERI